MLYFATWRYAMKQIKSEQFQANYTAFARKFTAMVTLAYLIYGITLFYEFNVNLSYSLPGKLFMVDKTEAGKVVRRGEIYAFKYYGDFYPHNTKFTKRIVGVAGDVVSMDAERRFYINGLFVGQAKEFAQSGKALIPNRFQGVIPEGKFWFATSEVDGFDSRYELAGLGDEQDVLGRSYRLF